MTAVPETSPSFVDLTPFVPRVVIDWLRDAPKTTHRQLEGTLAFVDISGFTALNERLAQKGKLGAEEVTEVMNRTFERLLDVAYSSGGGLLKFGGDALLLFFTGEDHAARACDAAYGMRKALRELGRPQTSVGPVTLKMHVGIHADTFDFFLVGESHRELLLTGPGVTRTVEMESGAEAGEILVSDETAASLPERILGEAKEGGRLLKSPAGATGGLEPLPPLEGLDLAACVPAAIRRVVADGRAESEHRQASVAFVHFGGIDALLDEEGVEQVAAALDELVTGAQRIADEHGVTFLETDIDTDGGKMILVAGAPETAGEDEERILRAARGIADLTTRLPLRIGTSRGRVFAGEVGARFRRTYTILGKTAALAARLMGKAKPGQVLTTADLLERSRSTFETDELEPLTLKGIDEPVTAYNVVAVSGEASATAEHRLPFVGRERELAILSAALGPVRMGFGNIVELIGEPGMGKSRLVEELQAQAPDLVAVTSTCAQYEASTTYFAFRGLLRQLLELPQNGAAPARLRERVEELCPDLVPWLPLVALPLDLEVHPTQEVEELQPAFRRARLHGVVESLLGRILSGPTLLVIEDVHWMDEASSELLRHLGAQVSGKPWLVCATRRPGEGGFSAAESVPPLPAMTIQLQPLDAEAAQRLVGAAAAEGLLQHEMSAITDRAGGNPLFLQELLASSSTPDEALPESVEAVVATRIDRLAPGDRALLRYAAVLGATFSADLVTEVLAHDPEASSDSEAWDRLGEFVERDPDVAGAFRFRHALIRDGAYEGLSYKRRRELHGRVADVIERREAYTADESAELLSLHYSRAERRPETWRYSVEAAKRAEEKYANVETTQFLERALEAAKGWTGAPADEVARVWELLGDVRMRLAAYDEAASAYREARTFWRSEPVHQARLIQQEAVVRVRLGNYPQALRRLTQALRLLDGVEGVAAGAQRAHLCNWYAGVLQYQWRPNEAILWCNRAIDEAEPSGAEDALAHAYFNLDWAYLALGRRDEAIHSPRAVEIYERLGALDRLAWALNIMGGRSYLAGRWEEAIEFADRARRTFLRIGDEMNATVAALNVACIRSDQGRMEDAEPLFRRGLELRRSAGNPLKIGEAASELGRFAGRTGNFEEAHALLAEARELFETEGDQVEALAADVWRVESLVTEGSSAAALELAADALERTETIPGVAILAAMLHRLRGWAFMQLRDLEGAGAAFDESLKLARLEGENLGMRSADYEAALTLDALDHLGELVGQPDVDLKRERDAIVAKLALLQLTRPPLPD